MAKLAQLFVWQNTQHWHLATIRWYPFYFSHGKSSKIARKNHHAQFFWPCELLFFKELILNLLLFTSKLISLNRPDDFIGLSLT